jgi:hypothetical protein
MFFFKKVTQRKKVTFKVTYKKTITIYIYTFSYFLLSVSLLNLNLIFIQTRFDFYFSTLIPFRGQFHQPSSAKRKCGSSSFTNKNTLNFTSMHG